MITEKVEIHRLNASDFESALKGCEVKYERENSNDPFVNPVFTITVNNLAEAIFIGRDYQNRLSN